MCRLKRHLLDKTQLLLSTSPYLLIKRQQVERPPRLRAAPPLPTSVDARDFRQSPGVQERTALAIPRLCGIVDSS